MNFETEFWANAYTTNTIVKFPPYIEKDLSKIIKIDKPYEKGLFIWFTLFKLFTDIFIQNSMIKSHSSTGASSIYMLPTQKHYKFSCRWQHPIMLGDGVDHHHC